MPKFKPVHKYKYQIAAVIVFILIAVGGVLYHSGSSGNKTASTNDCAKLDVHRQNVYSCYKSELTAIINQSGAEQATALLKKQYISVPYIKSNCHQLMHVIGRAAYAKYGNLAEAFAHGDQFCWSGFYHGIMEQISKQKGLGYITDNVNTICQPIAKKYGHYSFNDYNCVHGLGHGFMEIENEKLFDALNSCDKMSDIWDKTSCYSGVFMQNIMNVQGPEAEDIATYPYLKSSQPMYPCTDLAEQYKGSCYLMQTSFALQVDGYDFSKVFAQCAAADTAYVDTCYQSLGRDASGQSISNVEQTKTNCLLGSDLDAQTNCTIGAAKDFVSYFHSDQRAYELCQAMPVEISQICSMTVKNYYATF
jgi:hypothetical protein